jgi:hypothetical protein
MPTPAPARVRVCLYVVVPDQRKVSAGLETAQGGQLWQRRPVMKGRISSHLHTHKRHA